MVLSGKGGTGKTTIVASLAALAEDEVLVDCDVDAPNLHILLEPQILSKKEFVGSKKPRRDEEKCLRCGLCATSCRFLAIDPITLEIDLVRCEGCGVCALVCPQNAIEMRDHVSGEIFLSKTRYGTLCHARLFPGEANSGKLVTELKMSAAVVAGKEGAKLLIVDGPPGIGCPVISSVSGSSAVLAVAEPTPSGLHDLSRLIDLSKHFGVPTYVCINQYDVNEEVSEEIEGFCSRVEVEVVGKIPFDEKVVEAATHRKPVVEYSPASPSAQEIRRMWEKISEVL